MALYSSSKSLLSRVKKRHPHLYSILVLFVCNIILFTVIGFLVMAFSRNISLVVLLNKVYGKVEHIDEGVIESIHRSGKTSDWFYNIRLGTRWKDKYHCHGMESVCAVIGDGKRIEIKDVDIIYLEKRSDFIIKKMTVNKLRSKENVVVYSTYYQGGSDADMLKNYVHATRIRWLRLTLIIFASFIIFYLAHRKQHAIKKPGDNG